MSTLTSELSLCPEKYNICIFFTLGLEHQCKHWNTCDNGRCLTVDGKSMCVCNKGYEIDDGYNSCRLEGSYSIFLPIIYCRYSNIQYILSRPYRLIFTLFVTVFYKILFRGNIYCIQAWATQKTFFFV